MKSFQEFLSEEEKSSKKTAGYINEPKGNEKCSNCNMWRNEYDENMEWRNKNYEFFNTLIQSVINNRSHVYNYDTNSINEYI